MTDEQKKKISESKKMAFSLLTDEEKKNSGQFQKGKDHPNYGSPLTEEHKRKISEAQMGVKNHNFGKKTTDLVKKKISYTAIKNGKNRKENLSEETIRRKSEGQKGHTVSEETRKKISDSKKGSKVTDETRKRMSESKMGAKNHMYGKHHTAESIEKMSNSSSGEKSPNFGKHLPEVVRKKISESKIGEKNHMYGKHHTAESIEKMSNAHKKENLSPETLERLSISSRRENLTPETLERMSDVKKGENNSNWQGGVSFGDYNKDFNYRFKEKIRNKFNRECFVCGLFEKKNGRKLDVHHVNYDKMCSCNDSNFCFIPLCDCCHIKTNYNRGFWEKLFTVCLQDPLMMEYFT